MYCLFGCGQPVCYVCVSADVVFNALCRFPTKITKKSTETPEIHIKGVYNEFTEQFKFLGQTFHASLKDDNDIQKPVKSHC